MLSTVVLCVRESLKCSVALCLYPHGSEVIRSWECWVIEMLEWRASENVKIVYGSQIKK